MTERPYESKITAMGVTVTTEPETADAELIARGEGIMHGINHGGEAANSAIGDIRLEIANIVHAASVGESQELQFAQRERLQELYAAYEKLTGKSTVE